MCGEMFLADIRIRDIFKLRNVECGMRNINSEIYIPKSLPTGRQAQSEIRI